MDNVQEILTIAKKLIQIPSTGDNVPALKDVMNFCTEIVDPSYFIQKYEYNHLPSLLIHNKQKPTDQFKLILNAHVDVVPGTPSQFNPYILGKRLFGRGAYDMKSAAAVMILVFNELAKKVSYPLALQLVADEESSSNNATQYQIEQGIRGEFVICGESSSNLDITYKAKGALWFIITVKGTTAHGGYPWRGDNALWKLITILTSLKKAYPVPQQEQWISTINLAKIETHNEAFNLIPNEAKAFIDMRYIDHDAESILKQVSVFIPSDAKITIIQNTLPTYINEHNYFLQKLRNSISRIRGSNSQLRAAHATSDLRLYNTVGCVGVEFGVIGKNQHGDNEYVELESLSQYYRILSHFILSLSHDKLV